MNAFPPSDTYGSAISVGSPIIHVRISGGRPLTEDRDRRAVDGTGGRTFIVSVANSPVRNTVVVQLSDGQATVESPLERANRVLFAHLNDLVFAHSHFVSVRDKFDFGGRAALKAAVQSMIDRFERIESAASADGDDGEFTAALKAFGSAYQGRTDALVAKIEAIATEAAMPSMAGKVGGYLQKLFESVLNTAVTAGVGAALKPG